MKCFKIIIVSLLATSLFSCQKELALNSRIIPQDSLVVAGGVIRAYPIPVVGSIIPWAFIVDAGHDKNFFDSVKAQPSGAIRVYYPKVKKTLSFIAVGDEQLKYYQMGASVDMAWADIFVSSLVTNGGELKGNNTKDWTRTGEITKWDVVRDSTSGLTKINITTPNGTVVTADDYAKLSITYTGTNQRLIKRQYSGMGIYNVGFYLTNLNGDIIKGKSDPNDRLVLNSNPTQKNLNCYSVQGDSSQLKIFNTTANIWLSAQFIK
jgi:hypothetical protein